jgi:hypothetical protein
LHASFDVLKTKVGNMTLSPLNDSRSTISIRTYATPDLEETNTQIDAIVMRYGLPSVQDDAELGFANRSV